MSHYDPAEEIYRPVTQISTCGNWTVYRNSL